MSQDDVELVRRYYELFNAGDKEAAEALWADDFVADTSRRLVEPGVFRGREAAKAAAARVAETWASLVVEPTELIESGCRVVAVLHNRAVGRDGIEVEATTGAVWTARDGRLTRFEYFGTPEEAFEAAGLRDRG